jgi:hypothetical protein
MQPKLFYDDEYDAFARMIADSGRPFKDVAAFLFPHLGDRSAYARLKNCLNPDRDEHLTFGQVLAVMRFCVRFDPLYFACDELSHKRPDPVTKEDELTALLRAYLEAKKTTDLLEPKIEKLRVA